MSDDLEKRVEQFQCFELPGQPMSMHMGTSYLVNDLWEEVQRTRNELAAEQNRRFEGNRIASEENREDLAQERERCARIVQDNSERAIDPVIKAVLMLNAQEIRHHGKGDRQ